MIKAASYSHLVKRVIVRSFGHASAERGFLDPDYKRNSRGPVSQNKGRSTLSLGRYLADTAEVFAESENKLSQTRRVKASAE